MEKIGRLKAAMIRWTKAQYARGFNMWSVLAAARSRALQALRRGFSAFTNRKLRAGYNTIVSRADYLRSIRTTALVVVETMRDASPGGKPTE